MFINHLLRFINYHWLGWVFFTASLALAWFLDLSRGLLSSTKLSLATDY